MPYYVAPNNRIAVTAPGATLHEPGFIEFPAELGSTLKLRHGEIVDDAVADSLRNPALPTSGSPGAHRVQRPGRWEHKVVLVSETGGFATANGVAERVRRELDDAAPEGWELAHTTQRDNRYVGGESIMLIFRRRVVTEAELIEDLKRRERLRRRAMQELDAEAVVAGVSLPESAPGR